MREDDIIKALQDTEKASMRRAVVGIGIGITFILALVIVPMLVGINDAGYRTVIQYPSGELAVKFDSGLYYQGFGRVTEYKDVISYDFNRTLGDDDNATVETQGAPVRYQDGGNGTVYGIARFKLPVDEESMLRLHKEFRSNDGVASKMVVTSVQEIMNHTAGLMTSEESYAELRGTYGEWAREQMNFGKFKTRQKEIITTDEGMEFCLDKSLPKEQERECRDVKRVTKHIPVIDLTNEGKPIYLTSDLNAFGLSLSGFQMVDWDYEPKTLTQISKKREATMAIITAKADAEKAKQEAITAEQQGLANVMSARYEKEVEKAREVVDAEKRVELAKQAKLEAEQQKLAAAEIKQKEILLGQGESERKRLVMQADGALQQKLDTYERVMNRFAAAIEKQKWVPEIQMGSSGGSSGSASVDLINMLNAKTAKELALDMSMKSGK